MSLLCRENLSRLVLLEEQGRAWLSCNPLVTELQRSVSWHLLTWKKLIFFLSPTTPTYSALTMQCHLLIFSENQQCGSWGHCMLLKALPWCREEFLRTFRAAVIWWTPICTTSSLWRANLNSRLQSRAGSPLGWQKPGCSVAGGGSHKWPQLQVLSFSGATFWVSLEQL